MGKSKPLTEETLGEQFNRLGSEWRLPGFKEIEKDEKEENVVIPFTKEKHLTTVINKDRKLSGRKNTKIKNEITYDESITKPIDIELNEEQQRRIKMSKEGYNFLERATELGILPNGRVTFTKNGTPNTEQLVQCAILFFTEAYFNLSNETAAYIYSNSKLLTNKVIKKYHVDMLHSNDKVKLEDKKYNITTIMKTFYRRLYENTGRNKKAVPDTILLVNGKAGSRGCWEILPYVQKLGYIGLKKIMSTMEPINVKEATQIINNAKEEYENSEVPKINETEVAKTDETDDAPKTSVEHVTGPIKKKIAKGDRHGVKVKIVKFPDGKVEVDLEL